MYSEKEQNFPFKSTADERFLFPPADPWGITSKEVYQEFQRGYDIFRRSDAKGCLDNMFRAPSAYTAQLLILHQHGTDSQYRTANQI